jgi:hypothetical protein
MFSLPLETGHDVCGTWRVAHDVVGHAPGEQAFEVAVARGRQLR